ncbi:uncharacterized protein F5891DRAFT_613716 [Suillus fuscotomentosus]|uniref:Secreted protein n=1 Tax=Suillus fuscotomentosus TaxID=1912939 RepID=A0AAD4HGT7_9AGAM|nr:uncharacterized protein F5891DRAFT_613716 [Suillus fuscotomentosus]KAG1896038.1 hypothetical protein F5891DRAFT_613716 [Suillus fuscotomentosus]
MNPPHSSAAALAFVLAPASASLNSFVTSLRPSRRGSGARGPTLPPLDREAGTANQTANLPRATVSFSQVVSFYA